MSSIFNKAKNLVEEMIENGYSESSIEKMLEENPLKEGDYRIDTIIFHIPGFSTSFWEESEKMDEDEEIPVEEKITIPGSKYFKFYLGSRNLWKEEFDEFCLFQEALEKSVNIKDEETQLKLAKKHRDYIISLHKKYITLPSGLQRIRRFAFENNLHYDVGYLNILEGFRSYERRGRLEKKWKEFGEKPEKLEPLIPFTISLYEPESMLVQAFLFHVGYLAGEAEMFEKIGREIYKLKTYSEKNISEEEVLRKALKKNKFF